MAEIALGISATRKDWVVVVAVFKGLSRFGQGLLALLVLVWIALAISFHATGFLKLILWLLWLGAALSFVVLAMRSQWARIGIGAALLGVAAGVWFLSLQPRDDRVWAADVAHGVSGTVTGNLATLSNVRSFLWQSETVAKEQWVTRQVNLDQITTVDLISSIWANPSIAHTLVSFGFADGQHIVFSVEIRKELGESYSALGGFFRRFELVIIAAEESDIVWLRTDMRKETVSLYPITLDAVQQKALFLGFLSRANDLAAKPEWYNTLNTNCTTLPFQLVRGIAPDVALDWRVLLSGHLQSYLYDMGVLRPDLEYTEMTARARLPVHGPLEADVVAYSKAIRAAWAD